MREAFHKLYKDKRGWTYVVRQVVDEFGSEKYLWRICFHKKGTPADKWTKVRGTEVYNDDDKAERDIQKMARDRGWTLVI